MLISACESIIIESTQVTLIFDLSLVTMKAAPAHSDFQNSCSLTYEKFTTVKFIQILFAPLKTFFKFQKSESLCSASYAVLSPTPRKTTTNIVEEPIISKPEIIEFSLIRFSCEQLNNLDSNFCFFSIQCLLSNFETKMKTKTLLV